MRTWDCVYSFYDPKTDMELRVELQGGGWRWYAWDVLADCRESQADKLFATAQDAMQASEQWYEQYLIDR